MLQTICRLLVRSKCFRLEREFAGRVSLPGIWCTFPRHTQQRCERALRPSVIFRKVTYGFRSSWGADAYAAIRSVISTARLNGRTAFQAITATLKGQSVLPTASTPR